MYTCIVELKAKERQFTIIVYPLFREGEGYD